MRIRHFLGATTKILLTAIGLILCCYLGGLLFRGDLDAPMPVHTAAELAVFAAVRDTSFDPDNPIIQHREVDYSEGPNGAWWPKGQSPVLDRPVAEGKLPPVHERTGPEPAVIAGVDGTGTYGGTWYRVANATGDAGVISWRMSGATLVRWSPLGYPVLAHAAKAVEQSADGREFTFHLRRGMRWSDGHPVTARDLEFCYNSQYVWWDRLPNWMYVGIDRQPGTFEVIDDFTVRFTFPQPHGVFLERMCNMSQFFMPRHYLADYHPKTGDPAKIEREMAKRGHTEALGMYSELMGWNNPECPRIWPWIYRTHTATPPFTFVRNPYFWAVDPEGNQLPYIDQVQIDVKSNEMISFAAATGEITFQGRHIRPEDYTLLMSGREGRGYDIYHWYPTFASNYTVFPNMNRRIEPGDPVTRNKHTVLNDVRFRQALSLAIDRGTIIETEYYGITEPAQIDPGPASPFRHPKLRNAFIEYDPDRANALLVDMGLTNRDREGYRTFADGTRMQFYINTSGWTGPGPAQFLIDDWKAVGVRVVLRDRTRRLFGTEQRTLKHDLSVWSSMSEYVPLLSPRNFVPYGASSFYAPGYGVWYSLGGLADPDSQRIRDSEIAMEPPVGSPFRRSQVLYSQALVTANREEQIAIMRQVFDIAAENLWTISICTSPPQPIVVSKRLRNVPRTAITGTIFFTPANTGIETFYLVDDDNDDQTRAAITRSMTEVRSRFDDGSGGNFGAILGTMVKWLIIGSVAAFLILMAGRHPFVARRLVIMVPTLLIISIVSFIIIQLPPGDFLTTRITQLRMSGDEAAVEQAQQMAALFHLEESSFERYLRWMGLHWFFGFDSADAGLLQGSLGLSMEDGKPVNEKVGDRVLLTALITLLGILVTWSLALPIGIYSAVRQYSIPDYIFTLLGFIGMSVPPFLVALVILYLVDAWFGVSASGLFSQEYAGKPWSWAKFVDLMQHIWLPVIVIGIGGTAGMIRVMRGNLLDEIGKPYVTTARAKGVRSPKLLLKYPVRVALNPFISTIGGIFPSLVSGGAIVAIVLSLPTVGPQLLTSLMTEDMYFAGSMLMVLSLLGIFGTLVSDLLLLWLDPRIRMEGSAR